LHSFFVGPAWHALLDLLTHVHKSAYVCNVKYTLMFRILLVILIAALSCTSAFAQCDPVLANDSLQIVTDGTVHGTTVSGNTLYVVGDFRAMGKYTGSFVGIDTATAKVTDHATWPIVNGPVFEAIPDNSGGWIIGGQFTAVGDSARNNLAQIDAAGHVTAFNPSPDSIVKALVLEGNSLYLGGYFHHVSGVTRNYAAKLNFTTGAAYSWNPNANKPIFELAFYNNYVYAGGIFFNIGTKTRRGIAKLDTLAGVATSWDPDMGMFGYTAGEVYTIAFDDAGDLYAGGYFWLTSSLSHSKIAKIDTGTGVPYTWDPGIVGSTSAVEKIIVDGSNVYIGGYFSAVSIYTRNGFAAVDTGTALVTPFDPMGGTSVVEVLNMVRTGNKIFVSGELNSTVFNRHGLGVVDIPSASYQQMRCEANLLGIHALGFQGGRLFAGGNFTMMDCKMRGCGGAIDLLADTITAWNPDQFDPILCVAAGPARVYIGGEFSMHGPGLYYSYCMAATDPFTGDNDTAFRAPIWPATGIKIEHILYDAGSLYFSGVFNDMLMLPASVMDTRKGLAKANATNGYLDPVWNPAGFSFVNVYGIEKYNNTIILGGNFSMMGGQPRSNLAAVYKSSGLANGWNPVTAGSVLSLAVNNTNLFVGGFFDSVSHIYAPHLAKINMTTGAVSPTWHPNPHHGVSVITPYYTSEFVAGYFDSINTTAVDGLGITNELNNIPRSWNPAPDYNSVKSMSIYGNRLYVGGSFSNISGRYSYPSLTRYDITDQPDTIRITGPSAVCRNQPTLYTAATGIAGCYYQWFKNGLYVGAHTDTFTCVPLTGDVITCMSVPPAGGCYTTDTAMSNAITVGVPALIVPTITIAVVAAAAVGEVVTVNASVASTGGTYQIDWFVNSTFSGTTTTPVFTFTKGPGSDVVTATIRPDAPYCYDTAVAGAVSVVESSGVPLMPAQRHIIAYPAPFSNYLQVSGLSTGDRLTLYDASGRIVMNDRITTTPAAHHLSTTSLVPGIYFMIVRDSYSNVIARLPVNKQ
jgi:hypothetical protein